MNISNNFTKIPWKRRVHPDKLTRAFVRNYKPLPSGDVDNAFIQLTSSDFLNELSPAAHPINSRYMSTRPIWGPSGKKDENGKEELVITGFDELESVALGWQLFISGNKIAHLTGAGTFDLANETKDSETYETLLSWMDTCGVKDGVAEALAGSEHCGDSGILLYQTDDGEIDWKVYSFEDGYTIYPQEDENGRDIYYIQYMKNGKEMCDIISTTKLETWVHSDAAGELNAPDEEPKDNFVKRLIEFIKSGKRIVSDDGWTLLRRKDAQIGSDMNQFTYFRVKDVSWGPVELSCEAHENAASYVANEVKDTAFPLLVLKSEKVTSLPPSEMNAKTIAIKGTADSLAHSDVKFAAPPDASNIATIHFKELNENILRASQSVIISPDIMKQGADSSTAIKILFRPEIEWAKQRWSEYNRSIRHLVKVFKRLVGKVEGDIDKFDGLRTSVWQNIWIPQNEKEQTDIVMAKVYGRVISRKAAMNELGSQYKGDYEQIDKEWKDELTMKAEIPAAAKAKYGDTSSAEPDADDDDKNPAKVDNRNPGKSIQQ